MSALSAPAVEFNAVTKSYGDSAVIKSVTLALADQMTTAIVGESGSGKSTLLQIINGLVVPDAGEVTVLGKPLDYNNLPLTRRQMGFAVQGAGLFPHLTVGRNITLVAERAGWSAADIAARLSHLLALLNLPAEFADRYPHELSGGQQQRVSLTRAMMLDPPLLLLDEPFSALDPITREGIHEEFIALQRAGSRAIVLVTHDLAEAEKLAQVVVILRDGEVVRQGSPADIRADPGSDYVAELFGGR